MLHGKKLVATLKITINSIFPLLASFSDINERSHTKTRSHRYVYTALIVIEDDKSIATGSKL